MSAPEVVTMSTSCIMKHKVTGVTYMDMVTTSVGRVALSGPEQETLAQGPKIQDLTDLIWEVAGYLWAVGANQLPLLGR